MLLGSPVRWVCTSIKPGRHVALDKSMGAAPLGADVEAAGPTAVIVPIASNTMSWSVSMRPDRTSKSLPQRKAPGAANVNGAVTITASTKQHIHRIRPISLPHFDRSDCKDLQHTSRRRIRKTAPDTSLAERVECPARTTLFNCHF